MIILNGLVLGISTDVAPGSKVWEYAEIFFTVFFSVELSWRLHMSGFRNWSRDDAFWNIFDFLVLVFAGFDFTLTHFGHLILSSDTVDLKGVMLIKILRLARLARLFRLIQFKAFAELRMMIEGVV